MKFHYLLVDDLVERKEFERLVEEKVAESGDLLDSRTAAMLVVKDLGRVHVRIRDLRDAPSLACFFAKVVSIGEPREFERPDGSTGLVAGVMVCDETGKTRLTLWDEKAAGVAQLGVGDVLEILGRPKVGGGSPEVTAVAIQEASCEIACPDDHSALPASIEDLKVRIIAIEEPRTFRRRDGSSGEMVEAVIGSEDGAFRLVVWAPEILNEVGVGENVVIRGATQRDSDRGVEFSLGEKGSILHSDQEITVPIDSVMDVREGGRYSLAGTVRTVKPPHSFTTRGGRRSSVRNLVFADETGEIPVVVWGEKAKDYLVPGDRIEIYNVEARRGRYVDIEVHVSWGSALIIVSDDEEEVEIEGTIIATAEGVCIDTGDTCYLLEEPLAIGHEVRVRGRLSRGVITVSQTEPLFPDPEDLQRRLDYFLERS